MERRRPGTAGTLGDPQRSPGNRDTQGGTRPAHPLAMRWPWSPRSAARPPAFTRPPEPEDDGADAPEAFTCTTCGRTDLPEAGDWDPPICQECDAAINFDTEAQALGWEA
jgi:hypothetical protein